MSGSGFTCVRRCFCCLNLMFWLTGCVIFVIGLWLKFNYEPDYMTLMPKYAMFTADFITILTGSVLMLLSFCGYCGSWIQIRFLLILYFLCVTFIFMLQLTIGTLALTFQDQIAKNLRSELLDSLDKHRNSTIEIKHGARILIWDRLQTTLKCCGVQDYTDWYEVDGVRSVPDSCCRKRRDDCGQTLDQDNWFSNGCLKIIYQWTLERLHFVCLALFFVVFLQFFGLISSMLIACTIQHRKQQNYEDTRRAIKAI